MNTYAITHELEKATQERDGLKNDTIERAHSFSLPYATKAVKDLQKKIEQANKLWG